MREPNDHDRFGQTQRVSVERDGGIQIVDFDDQPQLSNRQVASPGRPPRDCLPRVLLRRRS